MRGRRLCALLSVALIPHVARAQFRDLAPGAALRFSMDGVRSEIGAFMVMPPDLFAGLIPSGMKLHTLREVAAEDTSARRVLVAHPEFADYALALFSIVKMDSFTVEDGRPRPAVISAWALFLTDRDSSAARDSRARGGRDTGLQLGFWTSDSAFDRRLHAIMPSVAAASDMSSSLGRDGTWRVRLVISGTTVEGSCRPYGASQQLSGDSAEDSTAWPPGAGAPATFEVISAYGLRKRSCHGSWRVVGDGVLAQAFRRGTLIEGPADIVGWHSRAAVYRSH